MTREEVLRFLQGGRISEFNDYRAKRPDWTPDLSGFDLHDASLVRGATVLNLENARLFGTHMPQRRESYVVESRSISKGEGAKWVKLDGAQYDIDTIFPSDFDPVEWGMIFSSQVRNLEERTDVVFISYAHQDEEVVLAIDQWLRNKGIVTQIDQRDFFAGSRIRREIGRVMQRCTVILIFYSDASKDRPWTEFERDFAEDLEMESRRLGKNPPRLIYLVLDDSELPSPSERSRLAIMARGKPFGRVCQEVYRSIIELPGIPAEINLQTWADYKF